MTEWKQEQPTWCPHQDCIFKRRVMDSICGGHLPQLDPHDRDFNAYRVCLCGVLPNNAIFDLKVNPSDLDWFRWVFDALGQLPTAKACGLAGES